MSEDSPLRGLIHIHTWHSFDCLVPPRLVLAVARRAKLDFICVTDHRSQRGSREIAALRREGDPEVVVGAEYATDRGDLIGLFLAEEIRERRFEGVVDEIHAQGGLALLPHPYRGHRVDDDLYRGIDLVEVFNAQTPAEANARARADASRLELPVVAGADIHTGAELLANGTLTILRGSGPLRERLLASDRELRVRAMPHALKRYSQVVKRARRRLGIDRAG